MKIWDDIERCYLEIEPPSIFTGPDAPCTLTSGEGWHQREAPYSDKGGFAKGDLPLPREMKGKGVPGVWQGRTRTGRSVTVPRAPARCACGRIARRGRKRCARCAVAGGDRRFARGAA